MQHQHHFSTRLVAVVFKGGLDFGNRAAEEGFKRFGDFARQSQTAFGELRGHIRKACFDTVRRFKHHNRKIGFRPFGQQLLAFAGLRRQETVEVKIGFRHPCHAQRPHDRACADHRHHFKSGFAHAGGKFRTGIANRRRARIRNLGDAQAV